MANRKRIPPEPPRTVPPGGPERKSRRIDLTRYPLVAERQSLNLRLLSRVCGHDTSQTRTFTEQDVPLLERVASERHGGEQVLLRHQSLHALGEVRSLGAVEALARIAMSPLEDASARGRALASAAAESPPLGRSMAHALRSDVDVEMPVRKVLGVVPERGAKRRRLPATDKR